jgi:flagellar biosynthetic protein FliR
VGLTYAIVSSTLDAFVAYPDTFSFLIALATEILIGVLIGFTSMLAFYVFEIAGGIISMGIGFGFPTAISPVLPNAGGIIEQLYGMLAILIFLAINGHHAFLAALQRTFGVVPPGTFAMDAIIIDRLIIFGGAMLVSAVQISLPVLATLVLTDIALALGRRVIPDIPIFMVGMPLKIGVGLVALITTLPWMSPLMQRVLAQASSNMLSLLR